ncbi:lysine--tRNA ligase [Candidatus Dependentiae bacterium]|nr:lysine--tRNA ligase [Candidatus Dependentiae bacterium]
MASPLHEQTSHLTNESEVRRAKLEQIRLSGRNPWPSYLPTNSTCAELLTKEIAPSESGADHIFSVAGRIIARREHGKSLFAVIQDRSGSIQLYLKQNTVGEKNFHEFLSLVDTGDIIWITGTLFLTKTGEKTIDTQKWELLSKSLHPLPEKHHGLSNVEQRYRQRYLDLISNRETFDKFVKRSKIIQNIRSVLTEKDFIEVETPMLHPIPGGAAARPFVTHHNALKSDFYLRIAPELYLKRLVIGGMERVFEINRNFRNEGVSTRHNPEFTMIEFYMAHGDYKTGMALTEELLERTVTQTIGKSEVEFGPFTINFKGPFQKLTMKESLVSVGNLSESEISAEQIDATMKKHGASHANTQASYGEKITALFEELVEKKLIQPTFITGYPLETSPLAKTDDQNPSVAARFELFIAGMELANGYSELNDPIDQANRFKQQASARDGGDAEAHLYDADYITALEYGLPPTSGVGIGIDRLVMFITNTTSIKDVILFPTLKIKHDE